jgi:mandelate racemase
MTLPLIIRDVVAHPVLVPLRRPIRTAVGVIPAAPLVLVDVLTEQGIVGRAYAFAYTPVALAPLARLIQDIGAEICGQPVAPAERQRGFDRRFRLVGWQGLIGMAVSTLDQCFWDALGRAAGLSVATLLGGVPKAIQAYDSYGVIDPKTDLADIEASVAAGFRGIKIKIGDGDLDRDVAAVRAVRHAIGPDVALMVDFNQSLDPPEALRRIVRLAEFDLTWVEEPVPAEDLRGHAQLRARSPVRIQTGENWWFPRGMAESVAAGASDFAMPDVMKIGGFTGWVAAMALAQAASLPVSSHAFIEASAHALAATPTCHWLEHLDKASSLLVEPLRPVNGTITARGPGLGMDWDEVAVKRLAA